GAESLGLARFARQFRIEGARFRRGAAADGESLNPEDADVAMAGEAEDVAEADDGMGLVDDAAVEAQAALLRHRLGLAAGLHDAGEPEELVEPEARRRVSHVSALPKRR